MGQEGVGCVGHVGMGWGGSCHTRVHWTVKNFTE